MKTSERDRWEGIIKSYRPAHQHRRVPRRGRRILGYIAVLALVIVLLVASIYVYAEIKIDANQKELANIAGRASADPMNVLVLGSDSREDLSPEEQARFDPEGVDRKTGRRADTIIVLHIDEKRDQVVLVHFPRDLRVTLPGGSTGKINGAYQKGPDAIIQTVSEFSGLPIHHYVEVNFSGFNNIVNALGGIKFHFDNAINEPDSGLHVPAGCVELNGDQALAFVRVRKIDDDFGRIARQQMFIKQMMDKVTSPGTILNPYKVLRLVNLFAENVTTDAELSVLEMQGLALRLRNFGSERVDMRVVPSRPARIGGISFVIADQSQTEALFSALRDRDSLPDYGRTGVSPIDPADVQVAVLNGTDVNGLAARAADELRAKEFAVAGIGDADNHSYAKTVVFFTEGNEEKARFLAGGYSADVKAMPKSIVVDAQVAIVMGTDYAEGKAAPPPAEPGEPSASQPPIRPCD